MIFEYHIGDLYRYPNSQDELKLGKVDGFRFIFEPKWWCTDNVFMDLIHCKTGVQVYKSPVQLEMF